MDKSVLFDGAIPFLSPEVVLFFKSETHLEPYYRKKSLADFFTTVPALSQERKQWLIDAIEMSNIDGHSWAEILRRV
jgi:hypothetical protein